jgi:hypothetical protein
MVLGRADGAVARFAARSTAEFDGLMWKARAAYLRHDLAESARLNEAAAAVAPGDGERIRALLLAASRLLSAGDLEGCAALAQRGRRAAAGRRLASQELRAEWLLRSARRGLATRRPVPPLRRRRLMFLVPQTAPRAMAGGFVDLDSMVQLEFDGRPVGVVGRWGTNVSGSTEELQLLFPTFENDSRGRWPGDDTGGFGWGGWKRVKFTTQLVGSGMDQQRFDSELAQWLADHAAQGVRRVQRRVVWGPLADVQNWGTRPGRKAFYFKGAFTTNDVSFWQANLAESGRFKVAAWLEHDGAAPQPTYKSMAGAGYREQASSAPSTSYAEWRDGWSGQYRHLFQGTLSRSIVVP